MSAQGDLEAELERQAGALQKVEDVTGRSMVKAYGAIRRRLLQDLAALQGEIEAARGRGEPVSSSWLARQRRLHGLLDQYEESLQSFSLRAAGWISEAQEHAIRLSADHAPRTVTLALGPAPETAHEVALERFGRMNTDAMHQLVARLAADQPLGLLLHDLAPTGVERVRAALAYGVSAGRGPRAIAAELHQEADVPLNRALVVSRDQTLKAYRAATTEQYADSPVVRGWTWHAQMSERTCPICIAKSGTEHPASEPLVSHVACRCTQIPITASWADLGIQGVPDLRPAIPTGEELFSRLPASEQRLILGPGKYELYERGDITLADLVRPTQSPVWGQGLREATLRELAA